MNGDGYNRNFTTKYEFDLNVTLATAAQVYPFELRVKSATTGRATLVFAAEFGADQVWIEQSSDGGVSWKKSVLSTSLNDRSTEATVTGLSAATRYIFRMAVAGGFSNGALVAKDVADQLVPGGLVAEMKEPRHHGS